MILTDFPVLTTALEAAVRAPSPHNTQPWFFELGRGVVEVHLDEDRVLEVCDPDGREARLACGAALLNIELAIAAAGWFPDTDLMPDLSRPSLLARVEIGDRHRPGTEELRLAAAIPRRYSNRRPFTDQPVPTPVRNAVRQAARVEDARLVLVDEAGHLEAAATLIRRADHLQTQNEAFQTEMRAWTGTHDRDDGVPAFAGGPRSAGGLLPVRHFHESVAPRPYEQDPVVAVLTTSDDGPVARLRAGRAMQRVLLTATTEGLSASFYSQPMEIPSARAELRALLGGNDYPQTLFRLGYGFPGVPTPRRPLEAVVREKAS
ncbi:Acg family FMN-binding oxidoreductase [Amycolatopsis sp. lyj-112]|uniref:Acg family FMN-binding oxidoreductase n=1 Tax=Amycolatopsis sp. lyj-112 TaxID=2789288 RepID=UPI00397C4BFC